MSSFMEPGVTSACGSESGRSDNVHHTAVQMPLSGCRALASNARLNRDELVNSCVPSVAKSTAIA